MSDDGTNPGWGAGSSAYARLRRLNDDEDAPTGFFDRVDDRIDDLPPAGATAPPMNDSRPAQPRPTRSAARRRRTAEPKPEAVPAVPAVPAVAAEKPAEKPAERTGEQPAAEEAGRHGKPRRSAGRNVPVSIVVGVLLAAAVLSVLFYAKPWFVGVLVVAACIGIWELARAVRHSGANPPVIPLMVGGTVMLGLAWFRGMEALSLGLLVTVLAVFVWRLADGPAGYQRDMGAATLITVYVPFLLGFAAPLATPSDGQWRILTTLAAVVLSDTGGFVAGVLFGKHPMAPKISPKKSWEGFAGSIVASAIGAAVLMWRLFDVAPWWGALFGAVVAVACVLGDLAESLLKRDLGIKDMSGLLPGHGGLMDRLDSILFALPTAYLLFQLLAPPR
jgi:phosphatidate cytidylyltransferase